MVDSNRFKSKYLKASDLPDRGVCWTIRQISEERLEGRPGSGRIEDKLVMRFDDDDRLVVLKPAQIGQLQAIFGSRETDDWVGHRVVVYNDTSVQFAGEYVGGVRFRAPKGAYANQNVPPAASDPPQDPDQYQGRPDRRSSPGGTTRHAGPPPRDPVPAEEDIPF